MSCRVTWNTWRLTTRRQALRHEGVAVMGRIWIRAFDGSGQVGGCVQLAGEDGLHPFGTVFDHRLELMPIHGFGDSGAAVSDQVADLLGGEPLVAEERDERMPQFPRAPGLPQVCRP